MKAFLHCLALGLFMTVLAPVRADLFDYVKKPDTSFAWKFNGKTESDAGTVYDFHLTSQTWQGIVWDHGLQVYLPKNTKPTATMFLWNQGGKPSPSNTLFGMELAKRMNAPAAFLFGIPKQPLFEGKKEDTLIAETFVRYLNTKDEDWPLLFPMVKSLVKAMDALQAFSEEEWKQPVKQFVVSGASKRGWTTWLTGATDPRVKAIMPLVIDTLNFQKQMPHELESFGKYSEQIEDYTSRGLVPLPKTLEAERLWKMVDPYTYRDKLTMPKCLINGNNDPYWTTDALNLYWDDLKGDKWIIYVPNAGHNLQEAQTDGKKDLKRAVAGLGAFARHQIHDQPMPKLTWKHEDDGDKCKLTVEPSRSPTGARLWVATATTKDFRQSKWSQQPVKVEGGKIVGELSHPKDGFVAFYAELDYVIDDQPFHLSTQLRMLGKK